MEINQYSESQSVFTKKTTVPEEQSYSETVKRTNNNQNINIKIIPDTIVKRITIREFNLSITSGNERIHSFPGATSK